MASSPRRSRSPIRRTTKSTSAPSPMTTTQSPPPLAQQNEEVPVSNSGDKQLGPPSIADLDSIVDVNKLGNFSEGLDQEDGDGGDRDDEGEECEIHDEAITRSLLSHHDHSDDYMACETISAGDIAFVLGKKEVIDVMPENILETITKVPSDWVSPPKKDPDEPDFKDLDNPGGWNDFIFRPVYEKTGKGKLDKYKYVRHELPTGVTPVPTDADGKRTQGGYGFFIRGGSRLES